MGYALTFLLEDAQLIGRFGIFEHMLSRLSADVLPFELLSARGDNMLSQLEMILGRTSTGWQVLPPASTSTLCTGICVCARARVRACVS